MSDSRINRIVVELLGSGPTKWCSYVLYYYRGGGIFDELWLVV